jgi:hypothetical protein
VPLSQLLKDALVSSEPGGIMCIVIGALSGSCKDQMTGASWAIESSILKELSSCQKDESFWSHECTEASHMLKSIVELVPCTGITGARL